MSEGPCILVAHGDGAVPAALRRAADESVAWQIESASSGEKALQRIAKHTFDVVLVDTHLSDMTAVELIRLARQTTGFATSYIVLTDATTQRSIAEAVELGVEGYLDRSLADTTSAMEKIRRCAARKQRRRASRGTPLPR